MNKLAEITCGPIIGSFTNFLNTWSILATGVANVIFAVNFMNFAFCNLGFTSICNERISIHLIAFLMSIPFCLIKKIGFFVASSLISTIFIVISILTIVFYSATYYDSNGRDATTVTLNLSHFGQFFGVVCFSIEGIGLMLPIRASLRTRSNFRMIFNSICILVIMFYFLYGLLVAMAFGANVKSVILFNFGKDYPLIYFESLLYAFGIFVSFPYIIFPLGPVFKKAIPLKYIIKVSIEKSILILLRRMESGLMLSPERS